MAWIIVDMGEERSAEAPQREERGVARLQQATAALGQSLGSDSLEPVAAVTPGQTRDVVTRTRRGAAPREPPSGAGPELEPFAPPSPARWPASRRRS